MRPIFEKSKLEVKIPPSFSMILDIIRIACALVVFIHHTTTVPGFSGEVIANALGLGSTRVAHLAVVVFFILSGFLIQHAALRPGMTLKRYIIDRVARLSSVFVPALLLTYMVVLLALLVDPVYGHRLAPASYQALRFLANLFYLNQVWWLNVVPGFNTPAWSIAYEFWYYVILAIVQFIPSWRLKSVILTGVALLIGPKILILLPVWLTGVVVRRLFFCASIGGEFEALIAMVLGIVSLLPFVFPDYIPGWCNLYPSHPWYFSYNWEIDYGYAIIFGGFLFFFGRVLARQQKLETSFTAKMRNGVSYVAGCTFSLYLYHYPILALSVMFWGSGEVSILIKVITLIGALCATWVLALATEKQLVSWRIFLERTVDFALLKIKGM